MVLFGVFVRYDPDADAHWIEHKKSRNGSSDLDNEFYYRYPSKSRHPAGRLSAHRAGSHPALSPAWPHGGGQGRETEERMLPKAPCPAPQGTCLGTTLEKWPDVHKLLSPGSSL